MPMIKCYGPNEELADAHEFMAKFWRLSKPQQRVIVTAVDEFGKVPARAQDELTASAQAAGEYGEWIPHDGGPMPETLGEKQIIEILCRVGARGSPIVSEKARWQHCDIFDDILCYRPIYHTLIDGARVPCVTAEGLPPWAAWVATDVDGQVRAYEDKPNMGGIVWNSDGTKALTTEDFALPGYWRKSLCKVVR